MAEKEVKSHGTVSHNLEQFVLLAKSARGAGLVALVKQALEAPGVFVFGELLQMPNVEELAKGEYESYWKLLNLFAFGTYADYKANAESLPVLTPAQLTKLRHLTIVSLAAKSKYISYEVLLKELEISNLRELEDLIIEAVYADIIHGKLDQKNKQSLKLNVGKLNIFSLICSHFSSTEHFLEVDFAIGRDIKPETVDTVVNVLQDWCTGCETVLHSIEKQIQRANTYREKKHKQKTQVETEVENLRKAIKASSSDIGDESGAGISSYQSQQYQYQQKSQPPLKQKGLRGSGARFGAQVRR